MSHKCKVRFHFCFKFDVLFNIDVIIFILSLSNILYLNY